MSRQEKVILLVEDNEQDELLTIRALKGNNILNKVVVAHDGAEAIDYLFGNKAHDLPQIVLLDLKLPKVDGLEVLKRIRAEKQTKMLPVVILTTSNEESDLVSGYKLGVNSYVRKPVDFDEFTQAVKQLGMYWLIINQGPPQ
ncbi:MAG: two-component system response regulator [Bdellovibrionales bacterium GWA2_49_15]|nr:MAG: two-component system response regulator [Bdellovibrionales bacterium GWA2_49_15]HAZ11966.1 two-component system response regulator [Bdellovibrionales bacterium]